MYLRYLVCLLALASVFGGCSPRTPASQLAAELIQEGRDVRWPDGRVIYVQHRQGSQIEGVRLVREGRGNLARVVEADRGTISVEPDGRTLRVTLFEAILRNGTNRVGSIDRFSVITSK